jgi:hypothetical protein
MSISVAVGSICFGVVIGWITYYTMRKNTKPRTLSDITVIISALAGPAVLAVFPAPEEGKQTMFGFYGMGLAGGFFAYLIVFILLLWKAPLKLLRSMGLAPPRQPAGAQGEAAAATAQTEGMYGTGAMGAGEGEEDPFGRKKK